MNRTIWPGVFLILTAFTICAAPAMARQNKETAPRIIKHSESYIIRGRLSAISDRRISVEPGRGSRLSFDLDDSTDVYEGAGLISIASMDEVRLGPDALRVGDRVEVVVERDGNRRVARIISRLASLPGEVARRGRR